MSRIRPRLTYANVIATVALFIALGGGAYAAVELPANSVGTEQIKARAVTPAKVAPRTVALFKGQKGDTGPRGTPGAQAGARWALVNAAHTEILAQSGGVSIAGTLGSGTYLDMGADIDGKVVQATNAFLVDDGGFKGSPIASICGGQYQNAGVCELPGTNDTHHVWVFTQNPANAAGEKHAFYVAVF